MMSSGLVAFVFIAVLGNASLDHDTEILLRESFASAILIMKSASVSWDFKLKPFEHKGQQMIPTIKANVASQGA